MTDELFVEIESSRVESTEPCAQPFGLDSIARGRKPPDHQHRPPDGSADMAAWHGTLCGRLGPALGASWD